MKDQGRRALKWSRAALVALLVFMQLMMAASFVSAEEASGGTSGDAAETTAAGSSDTAGTGAATGTDPEQEAKKAELAKAIDAAAAVIAKMSIVSDWGVFALVKAGKAVPEGYIAGVAAQVKEKNGSFNKVTDVERLVIGLAAAGGNPNDVGGVDLIEKLYDHEKMTNQGTNGVSFALLALDGGGYEIPEDAVWSRELLVDWLLEQQNEDGGWALAKGEASNVDFTAMALTALAPYKQQDNVKSAADKAVAWLAKVQLAGGGFNQNGENSESISQVIIALAAHGIDPTAGNFVKAQGNALTALQGYKQDDGGFAHVSTGATDILATEQALQALVAYQSFAAGKGALFPYNAPAVPVSVRVEGPSGIIAEGTESGSYALEAIEKLLKEDGIDYKVVEMSFGKYISSINGIAEGKYGGWDGWRFDVIRDGVWSYPGVGSDAFALEQGDQVVIYYGDATQYVHDVKLSPEWPNAGESFKLTVEQETFDWTNNKVAVTPAAGISVQIGEQTVQTDAQGAAVFEKGLPAGMHEVIVTGYSEKSAPKIVREVLTLTVMPKYADQAAIADWAVEGVEKAGVYGLMNGTDAKANTFSPKKNVTRAEFAALLVRLVSADTDGAVTGPGSGSAETETKAKTFSDVQLDSWYSRYVYQAFELGIVNGVTSTTFAPDKSITREQMAVMLARALGLTVGTDEELGAGTGMESEAPAFSDLNKAAEASVPLIQAVAGLGLMTGSDGKFTPQGTVSREMVAVVAARAYELINP